MVGTAFNVAGILAGGIVGMVRRAPLSPTTESFLRVLTCAFTVYCGLRLTWLSLAASPGHVLRGFCIAMLAMMLGRLLGDWLQVQALSNRLGRYARERMAAAKPGQPVRPDEGFKVCAALFCAEPLAILGSVPDGLSNDYYPLAVKAVIDGLAVMGFVSMFGWGVLLSALPVAAFQGTITLLCSLLVHTLPNSHDWVQAVNSVVGLLVFSVALGILNLRQVKVAAYLPSLLIAPLIALIW